MIVEENKCKRSPHNKWLQKLGKELQKVLSPVDPVILALGRAHDTHDSETGKAETYLDFVESFRPGST